MNEVEEGDATDQAGDDTYRELNGRKDGAGQHIAEDEEDAPIDEAPDEEDAVVIAEEDTCRLRDD